MFCRLESPQGSIKPEGGRLAREFKEELERGSDSDGWTQSNYVM